MRGRVAEGSKALVLATCLFGGVGSNLTGEESETSENIRFISSISYSGISP
jgi:hypothetical protein